MPQLKKFLKIYPSAILLSWFIYEIHYRLASKILKIVRNKEKY